MAGGDVVSAPHARKFLQGREARHIINGYGPTENTTFTCCYSLSDPHAIGTSLPIGCPISNTQVYILDQALRSVPIGVPGELYIGGDGLAHCYLNQPQLTAEKFIPNPLSQQPGDRLHKTGDLVRFLADGVIEFLGRIDQQIKLRGFRIEPGEIEAVLNAHPTVREVIVQVREDRPGEKHLVAYIVSQKASDPLVLSFAQQRLWFLNQLDPANSSYTTYTALRLPKQVNVDILRQSIQALVQRHEILRATFTSLEGEPQLVFTTNTDVPLTVYSLSDGPAKERLEEAISLATQAIMAPFDLTTGPLLRVTLFCLASEENVLLLTIHHILFDGWSIKIFERDLTAFYTAFSEGKSPHLPELPIQYADFALWQRELLQGGMLHRQLAYWKQLLAGKSRVLHLPVDHPRPAIKTSHGKHQSLRLSPALSKNLQALGQREGSTLFMTLLSAFAVLLFRYTQQTDISIGTPVANRQHVETEQLIGFFVNTLVLCIDLQGNPSFLEVLRRVRETVLGAYEHQDLPFEKLVEEIAPARDLCRTPLFQIMFSLQQVEEAGKNTESVAMRLVETQHATAKFDFDLLVIETPAPLDCIVEYSTDLFEPTTIEQLLASWETLLTAIIHNPQQMIGDLPLLAQIHGHVPLETSRTQTVIAADSHCVHQVFEDQARRAPDVIALVWNDSAITYSMLNEQANQLASYLRVRSVGPEMLVGLCMKRSSTMILAILGILKAGGAYVPFDPSYPQERLSFMIQDSQVSMLLTQEHLLPRLPTHAASTICLDRDWERIAQESSKSSNTLVTLENLAYVIYTSGSSGTPKGVQLQHGGLLNLVSWHQRAFTVFSSDRASLVAAPAFDASVWELWPYLAAGASIWTPDEETRMSPLSLRDWLIARAITMSVPRYQLLILIENLHEKRHFLRVGLTRIRAIGDQPHLLLFALL